MSIKSWLTVFAAALAVLFFGTAPSSAASAEEQAASIVEGYRLGSGDKLRVTVYGEEKLTGEFLVSGFGSVAMPLVGAIDASGLTSVEFANKLEDVLKERDYLKDPQVSVEVLNYRPFYILGEVKKPGEYPFANGLTALNAIATAEGFTYRANTRKVFIMRAGEASEQEHPLTTSIVVAPGDTIRVGERFF